MKTLQECIIKNDYLKLKQLIKNGADLNIELDLEECDNIFFLAIKQKSDFQILKLLIDSGLDLTYINDEGMGLLDESVTSGNIEIIKYLVDEKGFNPNKTFRRSGFTPLMQAASYGYTDIVRYLKSVGAEVMKTDRNGLNVFDYCRKLGRTNIVKVLSED